MSLQLNTGDLVRVITPEFSSILNMVGRVIVVYFDNRPYPIVIYIDKTYNHVRLAFDEVELVFTT